MCLTGQVVVDHLHRQVGSFVRVARIHLDSPEIAGMKHPKHRGIPWSHS